MLQQKISITQNEKDSLKSIVEHKKLHYPTYTEETVLEHKLK